MTNEAYSLSRLHDIVMPAPISWWPLAPGVWVLICVAVVVVCVVAWQFYSSWQSNAYRRAGLALLAEAGTVHDISIVLKRVALAVFPREQVASLYGKEWITFLNQTCPQADFADSLPERDDVGPSSQLLAVSEVWIRHHARTLNTEH